MKRALPVLFAVILLFSLLSCTESGYTQDGGYLVYSETTATAAKLTPVTKETENAAASVFSAWEESFDAEASIAAFGQPADALPETVPAASGSTVPSLEDAGVVYITPTGAKYHLRLPAQEKARWRKILQRPSQTGIRPAKNALHDRKNWAASQAL